MYKHKHSKMHLFTIHYPFHTLRNYTHTHFLIYQQESCGPVVISGAVDAQPSLFIRQDSSFSSSKAGCRMLRLRMKSKERWKEEFKCRKNRKRMRKETSVCERESVWATQRAAEHLQAELISAVFPSNCQIHLGPTSEMSQRGENMIYSHV